MTTEHMESDEICRALMSWATRFAEKRRSVEPPPGTMPSSWLAEKNVIDAALAWDIGENEPACDGGEGDNIDALDRACANLKAARAARRAASENRASETPGVQHQRSAVPVAACAPEEGGVPTPLRTSSPGGMPLSQPGTPTARGALPTRDVIGRGSCCWCGEYRDEWMLSDSKAHDAVCPRHPMRKIERDLAALQLKLDQYLGWKPEDLADQVSDAVKARSDRDDMEREVTRLRERVAEVEKALTDTSEAALNLVDMLVVMGVEIPETHKTLMREARERISKHTGSALR